MTRLLINKTRFTVLNCLRPFSSADNFSTIEILTKYNGPIQAYWRFDVLKIKRCPVASHEIVSDSNIITTWKSNMIPIKLKIFPAVMRPDAVLNVIPASAPIPDTRLKMVAFAIINDKSPYPAAPVSLDSRTLIANTTTTFRILYTIFLPSILPFIIRWRFGELKLRLRCFNVQYIKKPCTKSLTGT